MAAEPFDEDMKQQMKDSFTKFDADMSGFLDEGEFTLALNDLGLSYSEQFTTAILKVIFEDNWESKKGNLAFPDFLDFMECFLAYHEEVEQELTKRTYDQFAKHGLSVDDVEPEDIEELTGNLMMEVELIDCEANYEKVEAALLKYLATSKSLSRISSPREKIPESKLSEPTPEGDLTTTGETTDRDNNRSGNNSNYRLEKEKALALFTDWEVQKLANWIITVQIEHPKVNTQAGLWLDSGGSLNDIARQVQVHGISGASFWQMMVHETQRVFGIIPHIKQQRFLISALGTVALPEGGSEVLNSIELGLTQISKKELSVAVGNEERQTKPRTKPLLRPLPSSDKMDLSTIEKSDQDYMKCSWDVILQHLGENGQKFLRLDNLKRALRALGMDPSDEELLEVMHELEPKSPVHASAEELTSMQETEIYFNEFCLYYQRLYETHLASKLDRKMIKILFSEADLDFNGFLDKVEFKAVMRKLCPMLTEIHLDSIFHTVDAINRDGRIEFSEFEAFLTTDSPTNKFILKTITRGMLRPIDHYLTIFKKMPPTFRDSCLSKLENSSSNINISTLLWPQLDREGLKIINVNRDEATNELVEVSSEFMRSFEIISCKNVPTPDESVVNRICNRCVRVCVYDKDLSAPLSNVLVVPCAFKHKTKEWRFGQSVVTEWTQRAAAQELKHSSANEWNTIFIKIGSNSEVALVFELCVSVQTLNNVEMIEMTCGWGKVPMWPDRADKISLSKHEIEMKGGSLQVSSDIKKDDSPTTRFGRFKGLFRGGNDPVLMVHEFSNEKTLSLLDDPSSARFCPKGIITPLCVVPLIHSYHAALKDLFVKQEKEADKNSSRNYFQFNPTTSLALTNFICLIDRPNVLCAFIDEWRTKSKKGLLKAKKSGVRLDSFLKQTRDFSAVLRCLILQSTKGLPGLQRDKLVKIKKLLELGPIEAFISGGQRYIPFDTESIKVDLRLWSDED